MYKKYKPKLTKKKLIILSLLLGGLAYSNAQSIGTLKKAASSNATEQSTSAAAGSFDVAEISNQIMGVLSPKLQLTDAQKPLVNSLVNETLNKKKSILPSAISDKVGYASTMAGISNCFISKIKGLIKPEQYKALLGLLPKSASSTSALAKMLF